MELRPARVEDAEAIAEVHVATWRAAYRGTVPQAHLDALDVGQRAQLWRQVLAAGSSTVTIALDSAGGVIGFAAFGPHRGDDGEERLGEVYAIYVRPDRWRSGAGTTLMVAAERGLQETGFASARLWVIDGNECAQGFYEHLGWRPDGARRYEELGGIEVPERRYHRLLRP